MLKLPFKYITKRSEAELGATTPLGYPKSLTEPTYDFNKWKTSVKSFKQFFNEFLALINNHKPILISHPRMWELFITSNKKVQQYLEEHPIYMIFPPLPKESKNKGNIVIVWQNPEYEKRAFLLQLHYFYVIHSLF